MKLVLYDEKTLEVRQIEEDIRSPVVDGNNVIWEVGSVKGIKLPFLLLEDDVEVLEVVNETIIELDLSEQFLKVDLLEENRRLKEENQLNAMAIMDLAEMIFGGVE